MRSSSGHGVRDHAFLFALPSTFLAGNIQLKPSTEPNLMIRDGCSTCHTTLEPLAGYFSRVVENDWTYLPPDKFPVLNPACKVAMAGDEPVSAARTDFFAGTQFAGLLGGGTLPQWRRRGIYRALVRHRAELAAERGYCYLTVDASDQSRPILERIGFECLAITTPYIWSPSYS
jgi:GNAT superfamily N-acetyltransferase